MASPDQPKQRRVAIIGTASLSRPVGRGPKVRRAVLAATLAEVAETGYAALTVERVAQRAGVHKTTIYRRWPDLEALVTDAVGDLADATLNLPDTGDIDIDLQAFTRALVAFLDSPTGRGLLGLLISDAARLPRVAQARHEFLASRFRSAMPRVAAAVAAGQLPRNVDPGELIKAAIAPLYLRIVLTGEPLDVPAADRAAHGALTIARAGLLAAQAVPDDTGPTRPAPRSATARTTGH